MLTTASGLLRALRLAVLGTLLVDRPCGALLGLVRAHATVLVRFLDVLVLTLTLGARSGWHRGSSRGSQRAWAIAAATRMPSGRQRVARPCQVRTTLRTAAT